MAEGVILSLIHKLEKYRDDGKDENTRMESIIKEMRDIVDIVRDKKFGEGRRLSFLVSDLVHMAQDALDFYNTGRTNKIEFIQSWVVEIKMRMLKLGVNGPETESNSENDDEDHVVVGLDKVIEIVLRTLILYPSQFPSVVVIKGMSGIGKTTLARKIYNHADVVKRFKYRAWVCVSNVLTLKEIIIKLLLQVQVVVDGESLNTLEDRGGRRKILRRIKGEKKKWVRATLPYPHVRPPLLEEMDNQSLLDMLRQHLQGLPYLIVLDDLPKQIYLESLLSAIQTQGCGESKLVFTSHMMHESLHNKTKIISDVHKMEYLDSIMSWQLFYKTINSEDKLRSEQKFPKELEYQGKLMLRKCGGLPLAIKEVANQLARKKASARTEWEQLLASVDLGSTLELLEPYYQKLDPELLPCFMYMALYKENTTLRGNKLTQIWDTAGELYHGKSYLDGLVDESVIDEVNDKGTRYRMNPVLHKLSIKKAEEGIGFEILGSTRVKGNPCHRVTICSRDNFNYPTNQDKYLVSLFFHGGGYFNASPFYWKGFEKLEILDLEDFGLKNLPEAIGTLTELRYLGLRNNYIKELPKSLGCLENLEVLDIAQNFMVEVPGIIWEMGSLCHVYMSDVISEKPLKIHALRRLETLTSVSFDDLICNELLMLNMLTSLKKLGVHDLDENTRVSNLFWLLSSLKFFRRLILRGHRFRSMPCLDGLGIVKDLETLKLDGRLDRLPNSFPSQLTSLTLANSCLNEDPMPLLGKLSELRYLKLLNAYTGQQMGICEFGFDNLEVLCIENLLNLRNLQIGKCALLCLKKLEIRNCPCLETLPKEVRSIHYLKELKMVTTKTISTKIRDSYSISNIRFVNINP